MGAIMQIVRAVVSGLVLCLSMTSVQAGALDDATESVAATDGRGILLILQEPEGGIDALIEAFRPSAAKIHVGIGNASDVFSISGERHSEIIAQFAEAGFNVCPRWGHASPEYYLWDVMRQEVKATITGGADVALLVDHGALSRTGPDYQPPAEEGGEPFIGAAQDGDEMFIGVEGERGIDDEMFARLHFLAANFTEGVNTAGCLIGH